MPAGIAPRGIKQIEQAADFSGSGVAGQALVWTGSTFAPGSTIIGGQWLSTASLPNQPIQTFHGLSTNLPNNTLSYVQVWETDTTSLYMSQGSGVYTYIGGASLSGDLSGAMPNPIVAGIQGHPFSVTTPVSGQAIVWNGSQYVPAAPAWQPNYISRLKQVWNNATGITIDSGYAVDSTNTVNLTLANNSTIVTGTGNYGTFGGMDQSVTIAGTVATTGTTAAVTGTGTSFLTAFGTIPLTGTFTSSSTTVTGTNSLLQSGGQLAINDLVGNATNGYVQVASILSDTSFTVASAPGTPFSSSSLNCIQQPLLQCGSQAIQRVKTITGATSLTLGANTSANTSGLSAKMGGLYGGDGTNNAFYFSYIAARGGTTGAILSSQRTSPYMSGVNSFRRVGSVVVNPSGGIIGTVQDGDGNVRNYLFLMGDATNNSRIVNGVIGSSAWVTQSAAPIVPPTTTTIQISVSLTNGHGALRPANTGAIDNTEYANWVYSGTTIIAQLSTACDGAQNFQWYGDGPEVQHLDVCKYSEVL